jgi:hypothetical protein
MATTLVARADDETRKHMSFVDYVDADGNVHPVSALSLVVLSAKNASQVRTAHSFHHRGRKEDQRGCYGAQAHRFERSACFGPDIGPWRWWWRIETERFRHMVPPENLKIDCVPAEYPDDSADSPQPSHRQISGRCRCCMHLVYHGCWLATCLPAVQDDFRRLPCEGGQDERRWRPNFPYRDERWAAIRSSA